MKILLLISLAIGLAQCDKLDRTYLPPPSSVSAGGYHGNLKLPLEFPKENYPLTLVPGRERLIDDGSLVANYPNLEFDSNRLASSVSAATGSYSNSPGISVTKNIYSDPSTTSSYAFIQTSTALPVETYDRREPVTSLFQGYSSTSFPSDPNLSYDQYLIQQIIDPNRAKQIIPNTDPDVSGINFSNVNISKSQIDSQFGIPNPQLENLQQVPPKTPVGVNIGEYVIGQSFITDGPVSQRPNINYKTSSNKIPQSLTTTTFSTNQYGGESDSISGISSPVKNYSDPSKDNELSLKTFRPLQQGTNIKIQKDVVDIKSIDSTTSSDEIIIGTAKPATPIDSSNINLKQYIKPPRIQAETDRNALITNYKNVLTPEGFSYSFDTSNGIHADESGTAIDGVKAIGSYSFIGDDGKVYSVEYTADENGFLPRGDHLPTAPPIPDAILRGIEQAEKNRQLGIVDDGSYNDAKYGYERYQGLMGRIPQYKFINENISKPGIKDNAFKTKTDTLSDMQFPANRRKTLEDNSDVHEGNIKTNPSNQRKNLETHDKGLGTTYIDNNHPDENNNLQPEEYENAYFSDKVITVPKHIHRGDSINSNSKIINEYIDNENNDENNDTFFENSAVLSPMREIVGSGKEYKPDRKEHFHQGYEYTHPQEKFNENDKNSLRSRFSSVKEVDSLSPNDETNYRTTTLNTFPTPNISFNSKKPDSNMQVLRTNLNDPFTSYGNINSYQEPNDNFAKPDASRFYNKESDEINDGVIRVTDKNGVLSNLKPVYTSTTLDPNYYQSFDTPTVAGSRRINYPSSSLGHNLFVSTTPMPSEITSRFTSSTSNENYPQTTPTTAYSISTLRPLITSGTSGITPRRPGYPGSGSGQNIDPKPNDTGRRVNGSPVNQSTTDKSIIPNENLDDDFKPRFEVSTDPKSQYILVDTTSIPPNSGSPTSSERVIGEDFSGPKQIHKFDPEHGYYY